MHAVALVDDQVSVALCPTVIEVGDTATVTVGRGGAAVTVNVAVAFVLPPAPLQVSAYLNVPVAVGFSLSVPLTASLPVQALDAVHAVALVDDQVSVALCPTVMLVGATLIVTVGAAALIVTVAALEAEPPLAASPP